MAILMPKKVKHRKWQKGRSKGISSRGNKLSFGFFGLMALGSCWISARQIEAARRTIIRYLKKGKLPRQTIRADIDYIHDEAQCTYGKIGVKVWIYKGEKF